MKKEEVVTQLRELRERHKVTQVEMAARMGITQSAVSKIERKGAGITTEVLKAYVTALGATVEFAVVIDGQSHVISL